MKKLLLVLSASVISAFALVPLVAPGLQSADASSGTLGSDYTDETGTTKERETTPKPSAGIPGYDFEAARKKAEEDAAARIAEDQAKAEEEYKVAKDNAEGKEEDIGSESETNENAEPTPEDQQGANQYGEQFQNYPTPPDDKKCGQILAYCAEEMVGFLTKNIPGTGEGGKLGCAAGVSMIIECAAKKEPKYKLPGIELSTITLYDKLKKNTAGYKAEQEGAPTLNVGALEAGDILVTKRASATKAGHTGVYIGNQQIVHNSSKRGYLVRQSINMWGSVWSRNPKESAAFRPLCN